MKLEDFQWEPVTERSKCGVYALWLCGTLIYIGQSRKVGSRAWEHAGHVRYDTATFTRLPPSKLIPVEAALIAEYEPPFNYSGTSRPKGYWKYISQIELSELAVTQLQTMAKYRNNPICHELSDIVIRAWERTQTDKQEAGKQITMETNSRCSICGDESSAAFVTHLEIYATGSEGICACLRCRQTLTEVVRGMMHAAAVARKAGYVAAKKVSEATSTTPTT